MQRINRKLCTSALAAAALLGGASASALAQEPEGSVTYVTSAPSLPDTFVDRHPELWPSQATFNGPSNIAARAQARCPQVGCAHE